MTLRAYLKEWRMPDLRVPDRPKQLEAAARELEKLANAVEAPDPVQLSETYEILSQVGVAGLNDLERIHRRNAPWVIFDRNITDRKGAQVGLSLASSPAFVDQFLTWLGENGKARSVRSTIQAFLMQYPKGLPTFDQIRGGLSQILAEDQAGRLERTNRWVPELDLLAPTGPQKFFKRWLNREFSKEVEPWTEDGFLRASGFNGILGQSAFLRHGYRHALRFFRDRIGEGKATLGLLERLLAISDPEPANGNSLRFEGGAASLMNCLLEPWSPDLEAPANKRMRDRIQTYLAAKFGHPRIGPRWHVASESAKRTLLRWMVGVALTDFFEILQRTADPVWEHRQQFWTEYHGKGVIEEAWLLLGREASWEARRIREEAQYGRLRGGAGNQSILQMRIGEIEFAEFSHAGKCWAYALDDSDRPQMYGRDAYTDEFRGLGMEMHRGEQGIIHSNSAGGLWQRRLATFIYRHTGIDHSARRR